MGQPVVHFEISGKDGKKLQDFYSNLFGWNITVDEQYNYGSVETGGEGGIGGGIFEDKENALLSSGFMFRWMMSRAISTRPRARAARQ